jgi:hypothetical protein
MLGFGALGRFPLGENFRGGRVASLSVTLDGITLSAASTIALKATLSKTLDDVSLSFTGAVAIRAAAAAITLADVSLSAVGAVALKASLSATLDDITLGATGALLLQATVNVTLEDLTTELIASNQPAITDTEILQLPINCVLAGQQPYKERGREYEIRPRNLKSRPHTMRSGVRALKGGRPSFTVTTNNRGYD